VAALSEIVNKQQVTPAGLAWLLLQLTMAIHVFNRCPEARPDKKGKQQDGKWTVRRGR